MKFGPIDLDDAEGAILAHTLRLDDGVLKKGLVLDAPTVGRLRRAGVSSVIAARLEPDDVAEDEAARRIAAAATGGGIAAAPASTGRANLVAAERGLFITDRSRLETLNDVHEALTLATLSAFELVEKGQMVATVKVIPFAAPRASVVAACNVAASPHPLLRVAPLVRLRAGLILTRLAAVPEALLDRAARSQRSRMVRLGGSIVDERRCHHDIDEVAEHIASLRAAGCDPILLLGASAIVDRRDVIPLAVERAGGSVEHLGMPVDPGNLLLLGRCGGATVIGVPGCARSLKRSGFDQVLERVAAGIAVSGRDIARMAEGGLLKDDPERPHPRRGGRRVRRVAAVVLAAGRSSRMGETNKLLAPVAGEPMVRRVVREVLASRVDRVVVVTGHDADGLRAALVGLAVTSFVHNPDHAQGMSTSVRAGAAAVGADVDGAVFVLGDMPGVRSAHIDALVDAFDPDDGAAICVPVFNDKRGNPVLWSARYFAEFENLTGDAGARRLLSDHADAVRLVAMADPGVLVDIDTPEALAAFSHE